MPIYKCLAEDMMYLRLSDSAFTWYVFRLDCVGGVHEWMISSFVYEFLINSMWRLELLENLDFLGPLFFSIERYGRGYCEFVIVNR